MGGGVPEGRVWAVGSLIGVRGQRDGLRQFILLLVEFGDGVRCSRSLLYGLPLSILQERVSLGEDNDGGVVQSIMMSEGEK